MLCKGASACEEDDDCCKLCFREFSMDNPMLARRTLKPTLERRAPRSKECMTCPKVIGRTFPHELDKAGLQEKLASSGPYLAKLHAAVGQYESLINSGQS